ncbi:MAG: 4-hydroxy-3-methylbut-2-enyl diphosphate reductase [Candidatus Gorgyraea atricola]|nr:4-hydroxy-3-methylbut-2-enyl diphosphate reductase [Candidatus Gorgyraea atricola]
MKVKVASHSGFCFGVKRAIKIAQVTLRDSKDKRNIYSLNPIIHNPQVVNDLSKKGLKVQHDIKRIKSGTVIISSHGAPIDVINKLKKRHVRVVDATCPFVKHAHDIVKNLRGQGYLVFIVGDKKHPEIKALLSLTGNRGNTRNVTRNHAEKKIGIISQTTQKKDDYIKGVLDILKRDFSEVRIFNTICNDTSHRQGLTRRLLKECDVMIVVGGKNSANTRRLWQICKESGVDSYHIEKASELKKRYFKRKRCAGIVSGASTPDETVKNVVTTIKKF